MNRCHVALILFSIMIMMTACDQETSILVEFTSTIESPRTIDQLELHVQGQKSGDELYRLFELDSPFPQTFLAKAGKHKNETVIFTVTARKRKAKRKKLGDFVLRRVVQSAFRKDEQVHLLIELFAHCVDVQCPEGIDCIEGVCAEPEAPQRDSGIDLTDAGWMAPPDGPECTSYRECDDGIICNGKEFCKKGICQSADPLDCEDGFACTVDICDEDTGGCMYRADHTVCNDGLLCNGQEQCDIDLGCVAGQPYNCDDRDQCTDDICQENAEHPCKHTTRDQDGDRHGDRECKERGGVVADDCDDTDPSVFPGAKEICNEIDDNCDGQTDEGCQQICDGTCEESTQIPHPGGRYQHALNKKEHQGSCGGEGREAVFSFDLDSVYDVFITTHGSSVDTVLYLRACGCDGPEVACNDDADGLQTSVLQLRALTPGTYTLFVDSHQNINKVIQVDIYLSPPGQQGDRCGSPLPVTDARVTGNTCQANQEQNMSCFSEETETGPDHVYYMVVPEGEKNTQIGIDACTDCDSFDPVLMVRSICDSKEASTLLSCIQNTCTSNCESDLSMNQNRTTAGLSPGLYFLFIAGQNQRCGDYSLSFSRGE